MSPLITLLNFEKNRTVLRAVSKILQVASDYSNEAAKALTNSDCFLEFLKLAKRIDFKNNPFLLNSLFLILKHKNMTEKFKVSIVSNGFLWFVSKAITLNIKNDLICMVVSKFLENSTLTLLQVMWDLKFLENIVEKTVKSTVEIDFLKSTMSYYYTHSLDFVISLQDVLEINTIRVLQHLYEIP